MTLSDEIDKLHRLYQRGVLSELEFLRAKARLLGATAPAPLRRSRSDRWLGGVCGGLAAASGVASWLCRLLFVGLVLCAGGGVLVYLLLWLFVPEDDAPVTGIAGPASA